MRREPGAALPGRPRRPAAGWLALGLLSAIGLGVVALFGQVAAQGPGAAPAQASLPRAYLPQAVRFFELRPPDATAVPTAPPRTATATVTVTPTATARIPGVPDCAATTGDAGGFRFSLDGGVTLAPGAGPLAPLAYTWDLDVDPRFPDVIHQLHERTLYWSTDAGCHFAVLATFERTWTDLWRSPSEPDLLVVTSFTDGDPSLAWSDDAGASWQVEKLPEDALGFWIDPADAGHWAFVGRGPVLYDRPARDARWEARPISRPGGAAPTTVTIAAAHPDAAGRWLVGTMGDGLLATEDGGQTWRSADVGLLGTVGSPPEPVIALVVPWVAWAPSDPNVAYVVVNRVGRVEAQRAVYRSGDGGRTWQLRVLDGAPVGDRSVQLTGGTRVFISPSGPDTVLLPFGSSFGGYGTDLFRSTDGLETLAVSHFDGFYEVFAAAFGPAAVRYLGTSSDIPR